MNEWMGGERCMGGWKMNGWVHGWVDGWIGRGCIDKWGDGGCMGGWMVA